MKTLALARATLRGTTWISSDGLRELARKERLWILPLAGIGILVGLGAVLFMLISVYRSILVLGTATGRPEILMFYSLMGSWVFLFLTAIPLALSVLYYSADLKLLLTLPVKPRQIVEAKGLLLYLYCLPVNLLIVIPALWLYIGQVGAPVPVVVSGLVHLIVSPLFPVSIAVLLVLALMKAVNLSRFRVALEVTGMLMGIVLIIGMQVGLSRATIATMQGGSPAGLAGLADVFSSLERALPPVAWAARGFVSGAGPEPILLSLLLTAAVFTAALLLAPVNFQRDVMERREGRERKGSSGPAAYIIARRSAPRGTTRSLLRREWAILSSNSSFIFEAMGELLILPLILGIYGLILPKEVLGQAMRFITGSPVIGLIIMAVLVLMTNLTTVSSTSISREGRSLALSLTAPVPGRSQVKAKLLLHHLFFTTAYLADLGICYVLFRFPLVSLVYLVPGGIALQAVGFSIGIFFDLKRPFLKWTHPQQAMKNNVNAMAGIGSTFGIVAVLAVPGALLVTRGVDPFLVGCGAAAIGIVLAFALLPRILSYADRQYSGGLELEV